MIEPSPCFVDLQVNGYAGVDFNSADVSPDELVAACAQLERDGVAAILATVITAELETMVARISRIRRAVAESPDVARVIRGIHVEGPFISGQPGYVGAHPVAAVRPASISAAQRLVDAGEGLVRLVTLAPECDSGCATTRWLADQGIVVSAGHCDASRDALAAAIDAGLAMFTHLGNGCPLTLARHDNIIQRALSLSHRLWICFIADGVHVPFPALGNYLRSVGHERAIIVSDAVSAAGRPAGQYTLGEIPVVVDACYATSSADKSHLVGSACPLRIAYDNLVGDLGLSPTDARRLVVDNPARVMGLNV